MNGNAEKAGWRSLPRLVRWVLFLPIAIAGGLAAGFVAQLPFMLLALVFRAEQMLLVIAPIGRAAAYYSIVEIIYRLIPRGATIASSILMVLASAMFGFFLFALGGSVALGHDIDEEAWLEILRNIGGLPAGWFAVVHHYRKEQVRADSVPIGSP